MVTVAQEMERAQMTRPLLIGGATTSRVHTALRIAPAYSGPVVHVLDASRAVGVASTLMSDTQRDGFVKTSADEYPTIRDQRANKGERGRLSLADEGANAYPTDFVTHPPVRPSKQSGRESGRRRVCQYV